MIGAIGRHRLAFHGGQLRPEQHRLGGMKIERRSRAGVFGGLTQRMTQPSDVPCTSTVTRITVKAVTSIRSRAGIVSGNESATASVTTPRIPAQLITIAARGPSGCCRVQPMRRTAATPASTPKIHRKRATIDRRDDEQHGLRHRVHHRAESADTVQQSPQRQADQQKDGGFEQEHQHLPERERPDAHARVEDDVLDTSRRSGPR